MKSISTHVLDISVGKPAMDIAVCLEKKTDGAYVAVRHALTDADGRVNNLVPEGQLTSGTFRLTFEIAPYFEAKGIEAFYPEASIVFVVQDADAHYHVPLLLSPFGYSTYRGS